MKRVTEIFLLEDAQGPILYAPLHDLTARINEAAVASVSRYLQGREAAPEDAEVLQALEAHGFFDDAPAPQTEQTGKPVHVTLFPGDGCNLRCRYCYASAGAGSQALPPEAGKAAVDLVAANARELGMDDFSVSFHGNGEPTARFGLMKELCRYGEEVGARLGLVPKYSVATNAVLDDGKLQFILEHFDGVNVSFDGLPEVQNEQRPLADGQDSFPYVDKTLRALDDARFHYGIRTTCTAASVERLEDMAAFVATRYPHCATLHIEPAWECGRCLQTEEKAPESGRFVDRFIAARRVCEEARIEIEFSAARAQVLADAFCCVSGDSFTVTPEGLVTACYEVASLDDPRAGAFIYGYFDRGQRRFVFDEHKRSALQALTVHNMPYCADCFCKYHCAGDCAAKVLGARAPASHQGSGRCEVTRALTLDAISRTLHAAEKMAEAG